jgi:hypothetical protein
VTGDEYVPIILQDIVHMRNRFLETISKKSNLYTPFAVAFGNVLTGGGLGPLVKSKFKSEDDRARFYNVDSPKMPTPEIIIKGIEDLYTKFKMYDEDPNQSPKLFLQTKMQGFIDEFSHVLHNNRPHILDYLKEPIIQVDGEDVWYYEYAPGKFNMLRGTNRDESLHRRYKKFHPEKCGWDLQCCMMTSFVFQWNFHRDDCASSIQDFGVDPAFVRLSNIKELIEAFTAGNTCMNNIYI